MNMEKLTEKSREALLSSQSVAREYAHQELRPIHLLKALVDQEGGLVSSLLKRLRAPREMLEDAMDAELRRIPSVTAAGAENSTPRRRSTPSSSRRRIARNR